MEFYCVARATTDGIREACRVSRLSRDIPLRLDPLRVVALPLRRPLRLRHRRRRPHRRLPVRPHRPDC